MACSPDLKSDDYYKVLGVKREASDAELAKAYKKLALKHHPDKNPDRKDQAEEEFKKLTEAYDVLRCPEKRKLYDRFGKAGPNGQTSQSNGAEFSGSGFGGAGQSSMSREEAEDIFRNIFAGGGPFARSEDMGEGGMNFVFQSMGPGNGADDMFCGFSNLIDGSSSFSTFPGMSSRAGYSGTSGRRMFGGRRPNVGGRSRSARAQSGEYTKSQRNAVPKGTPVVIRGLTKAPEHNGKVGHIIEWDGIRSRYQVQIRLMDNISAFGDDRLWLRPQNLTQLCSVEVTGLVDKLELNGSKGEIFNFDEAKHRYMVLIDGAATPISLQPANCILSLGTCVVLHGLSKSEYNGQRVRVISVDRTAARYLVEGEDGKRIKIRYEHALC
jgi:curved DNA-binding protein CbpA